VLNPLAATLLPVLAAESGGFEPPSIEEFFPPIVLFEGTPFALNRIMIIRIIVLVAIALFVLLGTRRLKVVPTRGQSIVELPFLFVRNNIAEDILGHRDAQRFLPLLTTIFFTLLGMNITGVIPLFNIAGSSVIGLAMLLAVIVWFVFVYAGLRKHPGTFLRNSLFPPGVPWPLYILVTPIELAQVLIVRPLSLALRLFANMLAGHLLLVTFAVLAAALWAVPYFLAALLPGALLVALTGFEVLVAVLQAFIFTILTAVYLGGSMHPEH